MPDSHEATHHLAHCGRGGDLGESAREAVIHAVAQSMDARTTPERASTSVVRCSRAYNRRAMVVQRPRLTRGSMAVSSGHLSSILIISSALEMASAMAHYAPGRACFRSGLVFVVSGIAAAKRIACFRCSSI